MGNVSSELSNNIGIYCALNNVNNTEINYTSTNIQMELVIFFTWTLIFQMVTCDPYKTHLELKHALFIPKCWTNLQDFRQISCKLHLDSSQNISLQVILQKKYKCFFSHRNMMRILIRLVNKKPLKMLRH